MSFVRLGAALAVLSLVSGCATVTRGTKQKFAVVSEPPGADVKLSSGETCVTPCEIKLKRKSNFVTHVEKAGYEPVDVAVKGKLKGGGAAGAAGNVIAGGLIGGIVDGSNGALLSLTPNPVKVTLKPVVAAATPAPAAVPTSAPAPAAAAPGSK